MTKNEKYQNSSISMKGVNKNKYINTKVHTKILINRNIISMKGHLRHWVSPSTPLIRFRGISLTLFIITKQRISLQVTSRRAMSRNMKNQIIKHNKISLNNTMMKITRKQYTCSKMHIRLDLSKKELNLINHIIK